MMEIVMRLEFGADNIFLEKHKHKPCCFWIHFEDAVLQAFEHLIIPEPANLPPKKQFI